MAAWFFAPMAGLTHVAFRELVASYGGCSLLYTEMCSAGRCPMKNRRCLRCSGGGMPELDHLVCQILGSTGCHGACRRRVAAEGFSACGSELQVFVAAICKRNCRAALLRTPDLAVKLSGRSGRQSPFH
ncbi:MAG: tRNA-dihydrouridine synthase [Desulfobacterales bacterium]